MEFDVNKQSLLDLGRSLSMDCSDVVLESIQDLNDLLFEKDLVFVKQYLAQKGARDIKEPPKEQDEKMNILKICKRGISGAKNREEVFNLVRSMVRDNPSKPGFKTGYKEIASYLNKQGYRDSNGFKWKVKSLVDFYHHYSGNKTPRLMGPFVKLNKKIPDKKIIEPSKIIASTHKLQDLVRCIIDSNMDADLKLKLIPLVLNG